ncbi:hypothetical protein SJI00_09010 [Pseudomonas sp. RP23018S]|uniref:hypothetical protein n=1 Tax=Pseudomonas sp. RP23018S TaxID=3096037 RepID=UPI002ACAF0EE|nr:hypothetical protein [Pseudomonas sp. RP23018S]MDZ5602912.1 hypothetical protein [Pseudomonas sp. RP23018S]
MGFGNVSEIPNVVEKAKGIDWGVLIDAYLMNAAQVGNRFAASVYCDLSGASSDGMTILTPPVRQVAAVGKFEMLQSLCGNDHYVVVTRFSSEET